MPAGSFRHARWRNIRFVAAWRKSDHFAWSWFRLLGLHAGWSNLSTLLIRPLTRKVAQLGRENQNRRQPSPAPRSKAAWRPFAVARSTGAAARMAPCPTSSSSQAHRPSPDASPWPVTVRLRISSPRQLIARRARRGPPAPVKPKMSSNRLSYSMRRAAD